MVRPILNKVYFSSSSRSIIFANRCTKRRINSTLWLRRASTQNLNMAEYLSYGAYMQFSEECTDRELAVAHRKERVKCIIEKRTIDQRETK